MTVILSHQTALRAYWENPMWGILPRQPIAGFRRPSSEEVERTLAWLGQSLEDVHVMVPERRFRNRQKAGMSYHVFKAGRQKRTVVDVGECLLASPELCYLQMAGVLDFEQLALLGYALCGNYDSVDRKPISSVARLMSFAEESVAAKERLCAMRALRYVRDGSRSPMESRLAFMFLLPTRMGGYGLPEFELNAAIPGTARRGDFCWMNKRVIAEYDSREHHSAVDAQERDSIRRAELGNQGFRVITIARLQAMDERMLCDVARCLLLELGGDPRRAWQKYEPQRWALHRRLMCFRFPACLKGVRL